MTSLQSRIKQVPFEGGNFITIHSDGAQLYAYTPDATGAAGSFATTGASNVTGVGKFFRDMGRSVVSSGITFRKVQLISTMGATNGVVGSDSTTYGTSYITGYIVLANNGINASPAPAKVARV